MQQDTRIAVILASGKLHIGLRRFLESNQAIATAPPRVIVMLDTTSPLDSEAAVPELLRMTEGIVVPGLGQALEVAPSWEELAEIVACPSVRFVQLEAAHRLWESGTALKTTRDEPEAGTASEGR